MAFLLVVVALVWLPLTAGVMIVASFGGLWLLDQMIGAPVGGLSGESDRSHYD